MKKFKAVLTIYVTYNAEDGVTEYDVENNLKNCAEHLMDNGLISTDMTEVDSCTHSVTSELI